MAPIQILTVLFVTFAVSRALLRAKDKKISTGELFFWIAIWSSLIVVVFFPELTTKIANMVGIGRGIDIIIYTSVAVLFYLIFRMYVKIEEAETEITRLVREIAMLEKKNK